ncbi:MAG: class I SAM-dependent methyltransferase [Elusimicrobia bacterium]|nr:class I SAM-dependent methyltransferase [Elusimicrobiota bacterium]
MRRRLLDLLLSPCCRHVMEADAEWRRAPAAQGAERGAASARGADDVVELGHLICALCKQRYQVIDGIPRLFPAVELAPGVSQTRTSFAWEWLRHPGPRPEDREVFLEETQIPAREFAGKLVLDAGCGMGRYARVAHALGAEVVAFDLSDAALRLADLARQSPRFHIVMGDLLHPPLREHAFDIAVSLGVLHHTQDTQAAFKRVAELVRPKGLMSVWVYGKAGRLADFSTNPLRAGRGWVASHRPLAWLVVGMRHAISDALRLLTVRLPVRLLYALCYPLAALGAVPALKYLTFSVHHDFKVRLIEDFDWLSPFYQYHHTKEELAGWFQAAGFTVLKILPHGLVPKPGILARKTDYGVERR